MKTENGYEFNHDKDDDYKARIDDFMNELHELVKVAGCQLDERFKFQAKAFKKQFPLLMSGLWNGSEKLNPDDTIESVINQGTLGVGFIGLAEALIALTGKHHGESDLAQQVGLDILKTMKGWINDLSEKYQHNYAIIGTPAEGLSGYFTKRDIKTFGVIEGVTDKTYYTNSNHVPVYYKCTPEHKAEIEGPYHKYTTGGHIFYVEADYDTTKNPEAIDTINRIARDNDAGYISINHKQGRCCYCNYESNDPNVTEGTECLVCHRKGMRILQRITGYLVGTTDSWNAAKLSELHDRVVHTK